MPFDWRQFENDDKLAEFLIRQHHRLKALRKPHEPLWDVEEKIFNPVRYDMNQTIKPGEQFGISSYDENAPSAVRKFAIGFTGMTVEKNAGDEWWLSFEAPKKSLMKSDDIKAYMQEAAEQVSYGFDRSTFYREYPECIKDAAVMVGSMTAQDDLENDRVLFRNRDPRKHYIGLNMYGEIDIDHYDVKMTAKMMLEQFEESVLPPEIVKMAKGLDKKDPFHEFELIHAIYVNGSRRPGMLDNTDKPYISFYLLQYNDPSSGTTKDKWILEKKGTFYKPINVRFGTPTESGYPISLAGYALCAATKSNLYNKNSMRGSDMMVDPPRKAAGMLIDAIRKSKLGPGSTTLMPKGDEMLEFMTTKIDLRGAVEQIRKSDDAVNDIFFVTFLEMLTRRESTVKTLGEIYQMLAEMLRLMGPVIRANEDDCLEPSTEAIWQYEERAGRMPEPPDELLEYMAENGRQADGEKKQIKIKNRYNGELARLKRALPQSKSTIEQLEFAKACDAAFPGSAMIVKSRAFLERALVSRGMPMNELKSDAELEKEDAELAARQQQEEQLVMAERMAKLAPAMTKDAVNPDSPAARIAAAV